MQHDSLVFPRMLYKLKFGFCVQITRFVPFETHKSTVVNKYNVVHEYTSGPSPPNNLNYQCHHTDTITHKHAFYTRLFLTLIILPFDSKQPCRPPNHSVQLDFRLVYPSPLVFYWQVEMHHDQCLMMLLYSLLATELGSL